MFLAAKTNKLISSVSELKICYYLLHCATPKQELLAHRFQHRPSQTCANGFVRGTRPESSHDFLAEVPRDVWCLIQLMKLNLYFLLRAR